MWDRTHPARRVRLAQWRRGMTISGSPTTSPTTSEDRGRPEEVLLATDGGDAGAAALRWICHRARTRRLSVTALMVIEAAGFEKDPARESARVAAGEKLDELSARLAVGAPGTAITTRIEEGDPRDVIEAASARHDLLVVGTNRTPGHASVGRGSFTVKLVEGASCPAVVVPRSWEPTEGEVVVAIAGDERDDAPLEFAAGEARSNPARLKVVHVWSPPELRGPDCPTGTV